MSSSVKGTLRRLTLKPLQIVTTPYRNWSERRLLAQKIQAAQHKIAEEANQDLTRFHSELWSHWPDAVQHIREHTRREESLHEQ